MLRCGKARAWQKRQLPATRRHGETPIDDPDI